MSDVLGVNKTLIDAGTILSPGLFDGRVKCVIDTYQAAALANPSTITMGGVMVKGTRVLAVLLAYDALGGATTLDVGDAEDVDRYIDGQDTSAAGTTLGDLPDGINYEIDETDPDLLDNQLLITLGGGAATGTIKLIALISND